MKITQINNRINFTAISLNKKEHQQAEDTIAQMQINPAYESNAKNVLLQIFDKHIKKEASLKAKKVFGFTDVLQDMYLIFFKSLEQNKNNPYAINYIIDDINNFRPKDPLPQFNFKEIVVADKNKDLFWNNVVEDNLPKSASVMSKEEKKEYLEKFNALKKKTYLTSKQKAAIELKVKGLSYKEIAELTNCNQTNAAKNTKIALVKMQVRNNTLPPEYDKRVEEIIEILKPNVSANKIKKELINNPRLMVNDLNKILQNAVIISTELGIEPEKFITSCMNRTYVFDMTPTMVISNITKAGEGLNIPRENYLKAALTAPQLFSASPDTIILNVENISNSLNIPKLQYIQAALKVPYLFTQTPNCVINNVENSSKVLKINTEEYCKLALNSPALFYVKVTPEKIKNSAGALKLTDDEFIKLVRWQPTLILVTKEFLVEQFFQKAAAFDVTEEQFRKCIKMEPSLLPRKLDGLLENRANFCKLFKITKDEYKKIFLKTPSIITHIPENIYEKTQEGAKIFNLTFDEYKKISLKCPGILCRDPKTLYNNTEKTAELLNIDLDEYMPVAIKYPLLINMSPEKILDNVNENVRIFNKPKEEIVKLCLKQPQRFLLKPETVKRKYDIAEFNRAVRKINRTHERNSLDTLSDEILYLKILNDLIGKNYDSTVSYNSPKSETDKFIKKHAKDTIKLEIPNMAATEGFVNTMSEYSKKIAGKNIFEFIIV